MFLANPTLFTPWCPHSRIQLLVSAEAGVGVARRDQLVDVALVDVGALALAVGAAGTTNIGTWGEWDRGAWTQSAA